jgi:hypothetical protein
VKSVAPEDVVGSLPSLLTGREHRYAIDASTMPVTLSVESNGRLADGPSTWC